MTDSDRIERLKDGVGGLKVPGATGDRDAQLLKAGAVAIAAGIVLVALGWWGASGTLDLSEHVPYLISGGVLGLCLVVAGTGLVVRSSMARLVKLSLARFLHEQQTQTDRSVEVLERLEALLGGSPAPEPPMMGAPSTIEGSPAPTNGHDGGLESGSGHEHSHGHAHEHGNHVVHAHEHEHQHRHDDAAHVDPPDDHPHAHGVDDHEHEHEHAEADGGGVAHTWSSDEVADDDRWSSAAARDDGAAQPWPPAATEEAEEDAEAGSGRGSRKRRQPLRARKPFQ